MYAGMPELRGLCLISERARTTKDASERKMMPREGIIRNHRHDEPLFVLRIVA
jgi:hypothetical protein